MSLYKYLVLSRTIICTLISLNCSTWVLDKRSPSSETFPKNLNLLLGRNKNLSVWILQPSQRYLSYLCSYWFSDKDTAIFLFGFDFRYSMAEKDYLTDKQSRTLSDCDTAPGSILIWLYTVGKHTYLLSQRSDKPKQINLK